MEYYDSGSFQKLYNVLLWISVQTHTNSYSHTRVNKYNLLIVLASEGRTGLETAEKMGATNLSVMFSFFHLKQI